MNPRISKGFILSGILLAAGAILVMMVIFVVILKGLLSNPNLAWRSNYPPECAMKHPDEVNESNGCNRGGIPDLIDLGNILITTTRSTRSYSDLYALSKNNGTLLWKNSVTPPIQDDLYIGRDRITEFNGKIYIVQKVPCISEECINIQKFKISVLSSISGEKLNEVYLPFELVTNPILVKQKFLVVSNEGKLYEIDPETLSVNLITDLPFWDTSKEAVQLKNNNNLFFYNGSTKEIGSKDKFIAFDYATNSMIWDLDSRLDVSNLQIDDEYIYAGYSFIFAINKFTGEEKWSSVDGKYNYIDLYKDKIVAMNENNEIVFLDKETGKIVNSIPIDNKELNVNFKIINDKLYTYHATPSDELESGANYIIIRDLNTGKELTKLRYGSNNLDSIFSHQDESDNYLYAVCKYKVCAFKKPSSEKN